MLTTPDALDRQIICALIHNGRVSWRRIADVLGQQERNVARRGNAILASGDVRVQSFPNPTALDDVDLYMLEVDAPPAALPAIAAGLAQRRDTHWVSTLAGSSSCVVELFGDGTNLERLLYRELAAIEGITNFRMQPVRRYFRTVAGWMPDLLTREQYHALGGTDRVELVTRLTRARPSIDDTDLALIALLRDNGRATLEELRGALSLSKPTVARRLAALIASGAMHVRAVLDPATLGYPVEALVRVHGRTAAREAVGSHIAQLTCVRWAAEVGDAILVQTATRSLADLASTIDEIDALPGVTGVVSSLFAGVHKRSTVAYVDGRLAPREPVRADRTVAPR